MRVVMIHAVAESMSPTKLAFQEVFPEAELVNLLDEGLFLDFGDQLTPSLRRRMTQLICYCAEHGAQAIGLACSVYTPMVEMVRGMVAVPVISSYGPVMAEAVQAGRRIGLIAAVPATLRDAEHFLQQAARGSGTPVDTYPRLAEDLMVVKRREGEAAYYRGWQKRLTSSHHMSMLYCLPSSPWLRRYHISRALQPCLCCRLLTAARAA
jgi:hypothetical protein